MKEKILIVEDQFVEALNLQVILEKAGYEVCSIARSVPNALNVLDAEKPDIVLLDIFLQGPLTGIDLAKTLHQQNIPFVYLSANSNKETLQAAKATHPYGFLVKPFRKKDVLVMLEIAKYLHEHGFESMIKREQQEDTLSSTGEASTGKENRPFRTNFHGIVGNSKPIQVVFDHLQLVAPTETAVLILGESGTGKTKIAECIHALSPRKGKPLITVNCATLPTSLIESHLFGHERGAFTGAIEKRIGKFEQANGGTIFLDEIGELPLDIQAKFLRALQEKEIESVGGNSTIKINARIIAATNIDLEKAVAEGRFRMDLYYRLNVFPIIIPPLRERKEDIPILAQHFTKYHAREIGKSIGGLSDQVIHKMMQYSWPGNIRELEHAIERAVLMTDGNIIQEVAIHEISQGNMRTKTKTIEEMERDHILQVIKQCNGKIYGAEGAAELLNINASTLNSKIKKLGIQKELLQSFKKST